MPPTMRENPPIPFVTKPKKVEAEGADSDKVESIRFEFLVDPSNPATRFSKEFIIFKDGSPEDYIRWLIGYRDLELLASRQDQDATYHVEGTLSLSF